MLHVITFPLWEINQCVTIFLSVRPQPGSGKSSFG